MRVLLVEDHLQLAESVAQALKSAGLTVDVLHDGVAADLALSSEEYAVAILDVGLPRMDGFEVASQIRQDEQLKELPIIMITSRSGQKHRDRAMAVGVNEYLSKPYQETVLLESIAYWSQVHV
ncbi:Sensor histidine kinase/response regulator [Pseudomonas amygdali pv. photiniae]|uniref:Sensor histidine kinase/response regulator n=1 Tax=Pseudomonas amygdali pv. photiniae TaxID=251724 RepID=A0A658K870_PSEA0|nr:Sensor histidine kinase/response regulator [Pseudomonas amygdali pv. photiniae]